MINTLGQIVQTYQKTHLYDVDLASKGGVSILESKYIEPGKSIEKPVKIRGINFGLTICYDLRFPEVYRLLAL